MLWSAQKKLIYIYIYIYIYKSKLLIRRGCFLFPSEVMFGLSSAIIDLHKKTKKEEGEKNRE